MWYAISDLADTDSGMKARTTRTLAAIVLLFVYQAAIEPIGMVLSSIIAGLAFTALAGERPSLELACLSAGLRRRSGAIFSRP